MASKQNCKVRRQYNSKEVVYEDMDGRLCINHPLGGDFVKVLGKACKGICKETVLPGHPLTICDKCGKAK